MDNKIKFQDNFSLALANDTLAFKQQAENMIDLLRGNVLENALREILFNKEVESLKNAYYEQDLNKIDSISVIIYSDSTYLGEKQRDLIFGRNIKWMKHILSLIR